MAEAQQAQDPRRILNDIRTYIHDALEICERGEYIELSGLDTRVQEMCEAIGGMSREQAVEFADDLDIMMQQLEVLQRVFQERRDALGEELNGTSRHQQAAKAYKQSEHGMKPNAADE